MLNNLSITVFPLLFVLKIIQETPQNENLLNTCLKISLKAESKIVAIGIESKNANETYKSSLSSKISLEKEESFNSEINILNTTTKKPKKVQPQNFLISSVEGIIIPGYNPTLENKIRIIGTIKE